MSEKLQILSVSPPETIQGKFGPFQKVTVVDGITGRTATAIGDWVANWKVGDSIDVIWENSEKYGWQLKNPAKAGVAPMQQAAPQSAANTASIDVHCLMIASNLAPFLFKNKDKPHLDDVVALSKAVKERLVGGKPATPAAPAAPATPAAPAAPVTPPAPVAQPAANTATETPPAYTVSEDEDDKPF
jgi:hypothetical protein